MSDVFNRPASQLLALVREVEIRSGTNTVSDQVIRIPSVQPPIGRRLLFTLGTGILVVAAAVIFPLVRPASAPAELPRHALLAAQAGEAFDARNYDKVITLAHEVFDIVEPVAIDLQATLKASGRDIPNGKVSSKVRDELFSNGPLNDVAVCYFYLGQAHRKLGHVNEARKAYAKAVTFTCARVWDPKQKLFWAPADSAVHWLKELSENE